MGGTMPADHSDLAPARDRFLSEEDLDLRNLPWEELLRWWELWLREAQVWNEDDEHEYAHGVFALPRRDWPADMRDSRRERRAGA